MIDPENKLFCRLDGLTAAAREQQRLAAIAELGVMETEIVPVFEEATQTAARFLEAPICILGLMAQDYQLLKSAVGLSRMGLMNKLAAWRQIPRQESFCSYVVDSHQVLIINDTFSHPIFAQSLLVQHYGIRAYLGVPLLNASGYCLGTLAIMDAVPRAFSRKDAEFLELMARWSISEFERDILAGKRREPAIAKECPSSAYWLAKSGKGEQRPGSWELNQYASDRAEAASTSNQIMGNGIKIKLLAQLSQELRTPLTSIMGMASVLGREVYGPLTTKQKEYLEIMHHSGEHLVSLVDEILALGALDEQPQALNITAVDIEMLCQQAINSLQQVAKQRQEQIRLSIEPGNRIWMLDKDKVRQMLYYLVFNAIQLAEAGSKIRIHIARKAEKLNLIVWVSHPWLGDGLPPLNLDVSAPWQTAAIPQTAELGLAVAQAEEGEKFALANSASSSLSPAAIASSKGAMQPATSSRERLGLLLSCYLAELHGGQISVQESGETNYRYILSLPKINAPEA